MVSRRQFIKASLLAGAGATIFSKSALSMDFANINKNIGIQLYSLKEEVAKDFKGTLTKIAKVGYKEFEFAGYFNHTPKEVHQFLNSLGVTAPSAHISIDKFRENIDQVIEDSKIIGHTYLVVPYMEIRTLDGYKKVAEDFNKWGKKCKAAGLTFCYHNHDFEFNDLEGKMGYDILLSETDKDIVKFEMDLYWVSRAGKDILGYFVNNPGRFPLWHVKDMDKGDSKLNTEIGSGSIDFKPIFAKAELAGMKHYFVEQENYKMDQWGSIKKSFDYLKTI